MLENVIIIQNNSPLKKNTRLVFAHLECTFELKNTEDSNGCFIGFVLCFDYLCSLKLEDFRVKMTVIFSLFCTERNG
jgi:hypothetical protein